MSDQPPASAADDTDPRPAPGDAPVDIGAGLAPAVAASGRTGGPWLVGGGSVLAGLLVFGWLASHRPHPPTGLAPGAPGAATSAAPIGGPVPVPPDLAAAEAAGRSGGLAASPQPTFVIPTPPTTPPPAVASPIVIPNPAVAIADAAQRRKAPALVIDLAGAESATAENTTGSASTTVVGKSTLNSDEQFAQRAENDTPQRSAATQLANLPTTIPQGVLIPGVLETALDSDLPGFTRAVVSRDVRGFDGRAVLVPRGSRVIGEYRSAAAQGASRAFVIWTRIIRPDGVSIQIGSSGTDPLGRAGLAGSVDRHFFQRFGGAILLTVVDIGVSSALAHDNSNSVYVGGSSDPTGLASQADLTNIPPTIKVPQGTPIRIFVARDLDFSAVKPVATSP